MSEFTPQAKLLADLKTDGLQVPFLWMARPTEDWEDGLLEKAPNVHSGQVGKQVAGK